MDAKADVTVPGGWFDRHREALANAELAAMPDTLPMKLRTAAIRDLTAKLQELREFDRWDPRQVGAVIQKDNYAVVERLVGGVCITALQGLADGRLVSARGVADGGVFIWTRGIGNVWHMENACPDLDAVSCVQVLPDGSVVSGGDETDKRLHILTQGVDGTWNSELIDEFRSSLKCMQVLPNSTIVSGHSDGTIVMRTKKEGIWSSDELKAAWGSIDCLQCLPDGSIVVGAADKFGIWRRAKNEDWRYEKIGENKSPTTCLQALPDGRIVSGHMDGMLRLWTKGANGEWKSEEFRGSAQVTCLQHLPDGRIVAGYEDGTLRIWVKSFASHHFALGLLSRFQKQGRWSSELLTGGQNEVRCLHVQADGRIISADSEAIYIWDGEEVAGGAA